MRSATLSMSSHCISAEWRSCGGTRSSSIPGTMNGNRRYAHVPEDVQDTFSDSITIMNRPSSCPPALRTGHGGS